MSPIEFPRPPSTKYSYPFLTNNGSVNIGIEEDATTALIASSKVKANKSTSFDSPVFSLVIPTKHSLEEFLAFKKPFSFSDGIVRYC